VNETDPVAWLRAEVERDLAEARYVIAPCDDNCAQPCPFHPAAAAEWHEMSSGVLNTSNGLNPDDVWQGVWAMGDSRVTRFIARHDPQDTIARCEAELAILDEHALTWPGGEPEYEYRDEAVTDSQGRVGYIEVKGETIPPYECRACGYDAPGGPCRTVRLLAAGYRHRDGYRQEWAVPALR
jgi:uncharacterized protein DUF6221